MKNVMFAIILWLNLQNLNHIVSINSAFNASQNSYNIRELVQCVEQIFLNHSNLELMQIYKQKLKCSITAILLIDKKSYQILENLWAIRLKLNLKSDIVILNLINLKSIRSQINLLSTNAYHSFELKILNLLLWWAHLWVMWNSNFASVLTPIARTQYKEDQNATIVRIA